MKMYEIDCAKSKAIRMVEKWTGEAKATEVITANFIPVNMWMVRYLGIDATLFLSAAYEEFLFLESKGKTYSDNSIVFTYNKAQFKIGLGKDRQKKAIEILKKHELIDCIIKNGIPKTRIISFNFSAFKAFDDKLSKFIKDDLNNVKIERNKLRDKMDFIKCAGISKERFDKELAEYEHYVAWLDENPGKTIEDYNRCSLSEKH